MSGQVCEQRRELGRYTRLGLEMPGASPAGRIVPELVVAPKGSFSNDREYHEPSPVLLVGEVTSDSTVDRDRGGKLRGYAAARIPLYLLIDRTSGTVKVFSQPSHGRYTYNQETALAKTVTLPDPLGIELDTAEF